MGLFLISKFQIPDEAVLEQAPLGQTYFSVREQSLQGKVISGIIKLMYPHFQFHKIFILFIQVTVKLPIPSTKFPNTKLWKLKIGCNVRRNTAVNGNIFQEDSRK